MLDKPEVRDPESEFAPPEEKAIAVAVTLTAQVSQNRSIVMQTYIPRDAEMGEYHHALDKLSAAVDRQEAKANLESEETQLALEEKTLRQMKEDYAGIQERSEKAWVASNRRGPHKLTPQEEGQKQQAVVAMTRYKEAIEKRTREIAKLKAVIAATE